MQVQPAMVCGPIWAGHEWAHPVSSQRFRVRSVQNTGLSAASSTWVRQEAYSVTSKGVRKPSVPIAKLTSGGSGVSSEKSDVRCSTVPSPPSVTQKSTSATAWRALLVQLGELQPDQASLRGSSLEVSCPADGVQHTGTGPCHRMTALLLSHVHGSTVAPLWLGDCLCSSLSPCTHMPECRDTPCLRLPTRLTPCKSRQREPPFYLTECTRHHRDAAAGPGAYLCDIHAQHVRGCQGWSTGRCCHTVAAVQGRLYKLPILCSVHRCAWDILDMLKSQQRSPCGCGSNAALA